MEGPEPSWIARRRKEGGEGKEPEKHEEGCGCGGH